MTSSDPTVRPVEPGSLLADSEHRTIVRLLSWLTSVGRADQAHPRVRRWGVPAGVALLGILSLLNMPGSSETRLAVLLVLVAGFSLPLLWRERRPLLVFWVIACLSAVGIALEMGSTASRLVALYSLARFGTPGQVALALAVSIPEVVATGFVLSADGSATSLRQLPALVSLLVVCTVAMAGLGLASRVARSYIAALEERTLRLEVERDQRARLAVATERARVAREMHDILGHTLAVIVGLADGAAGLAERSPKRGADTLRIIADSGRGALAELRRLLGVIGDGRSDPDAPLAPQPGVADLGALLERVRAAGPTVALHTEGDLTGLSQGLQLAMYRIVQEALTNTLKHAAPDTTVSVVVTAGHQAVHITVEDSGPSRPTPQGHREHTGQGLVGMRERAALYQGEVTAGPNSRGGWTVRAGLAATPHQPTTASTESSPK
ncbi:histidine kinase [Streptomyces sp. AP-93]|uniref:sensor histidine kinase n=1 Tax=Streptomyces sp. AP-93 TaxID=2929048 RepID=UPI0027E5306D|nr:histidine kinase [Streptomyces sp. AP-93]